MLLAALLSAMFLGGCGQDSGDSEFNIFEGHSTEETEEDTWNYYGCWKDENRQFWIIFYEDFTYEMYWGEDETGMRGKFELYGEEARLKAGPRYTPDSEGNLVNVSGDAFYPAEPPAFVYDIVFDDDYGEYDDVPAPDDERFEADESDEAYDFCGCWEDAIDDVWLEINSDGTYLFMWDDGYGPAGRK